MAKGSTLHILLESDHEPTLKSYNQVVEDTIKKPQQISGLTDDTVRDDILISLTTHSHRLAHFFRLLRSAVRPIPKSPIASTIATETVFLLVRMLPHLHQLLETTKVLELLIPALDICFASIQRPTLQELASVLAEAGPLLEYISSDRLGSEILRQWTCTPNPLALDAQTLESWTQRFVKMVGSCRKNHDVAQAIQQWSSLNTLKASLQSMKDSHLQHSKNDSGLVARHELPSLGRMTQLRKEDKKARAATRQNFNTSLPPLPDRLKGYLKAFDLQIPGSINSLLDVIKRLEGDKTTAILLSIATSFPCNLCILGLECSPEAQSAESDDQSIGPVPNLQIETLNKKIGIWKVLLSPQALRSLLHMGSHG